jgi:RHS repeat-associated protein
MSESCTRTKYTYDSLGRRTQVGGSLASTRLPGAVSSAAYDAANELTNWNGTAISYDANGNLQSDGLNTFNWNARNQVATLNSVSLQYDALGRRIKNSAGTSFLYDGPNATQELSGTTPTANIWTGGVDELFQRADSNGTVTPLTDALGSVIALVDSGGNVETTYSYDPFGNTTTAGAVSANPSQYTGRENEGNGLYFYRARYYSPVLHRFVSEDPLGFAGSGPNLYGYAFNSPTNFVDPSGMVPVASPGIVAVLEGLGYTQAEIDAAIAYLGAGGSETAGICASTVICGLIVLDVGLAVNDGWQGYKLGVASGWWGQPKQQPAPTPTPTPTPSPTPPLAGRQCANGGGDDCRKATQWHLDQAGIMDAEAFKDEFVGGSVSRYDICACKDGSIVIKAQGQCGKPGPSIETGYRWK